MTDPFEEDVGELDGEVHLGERVKVLLEGVVVGVDFAQLSIQLVDGSFEIDHLLGLRCCRQVVHLEDADVALDDFALQVAQFPLHVIAAAHLASKLALERRRVRIQLSQIFR